MFQNWTDLNGCQFLEAFGSCIVPFWSLHRATIASAFCCRLDVGAFFLYDRLWITESAFCIFGRHTAPWALAS
jgi:hypothetical protein